MTTKFTAAELAKLPKWAMDKILALQESECELRQRRMGHAQQAVHDAARKLALILGQKAVVQSDLGAAQLELVTAVHGWEEWAVDQKFAGMGGS